MATKANRNKVNCEEYYKAFPYRLRELREEKKVSQTELAERVGVTRQTISKYELGLSTALEWEHLAKIAKYFSVSTDYLVGISREKTASVDVIGAAKTTGLSEHSIETLKYCRDIVSDESIPSVEAFIASTFSLKFIDLLLRDERTFEDIVVLFSEMGRYSNLQEKSSLNELFWNGANYTPQQFRDTDDYIRDDLAAEGCIHRITSKIQGILERYLENKMYVDITEAK